MNRKLGFQQFKALLFVKGFFALFLALTGSASAVDIKDTNYPIPSGAYYVSPSGKDTNSGKTPDSPWTVAQALSKAPSGATIVFRGGTYRNISNNIRKRLTLQSYPHEKVWIKGSIVVTDWVADGNIWRKDGWTYSFPSKLSSEYIDPKYPMAGYRDMVYIGGVSQKQVASIAEVEPGTFYVDYANNKLYVGSNPEGKTVEATALSRAFSLGVSPTADPSDTVIRGLGFEHYAEAGVAIGAARVTLEDNTFAWNGEQGVRIWGLSNGTDAPSTDAIVRGNTFSYNGRNGLWGDKANRMLLENNTISYNNVERFATDHDAAGIKVVKSNDLVWRNNIVEKNYAAGMWMDISTTGVTIVHNTIRNNKGTGIFFEISHKAIIAANLIYKNSIGILVSNSSSARVYNNTLASNGINLRIKDTTRDNTNSSEVAAGITWIARNNVVKNNIFSNTTSGALLDASNCGTNERSDLMFAAADYNAYYRQSSSVRPNAVVWTFGPGKCMVNYPSVAAFNSALGYEEHALSIDDVATNPFFVDEENEDFSLKEGSSAIGRGESLPSDIARATGWASGRAVDLGAIQSQVVLVSMSQL